MIQQESDGWHVVVHVDGQLIQRSPVLRNREAAVTAAEVISEKFEANFKRVGGRWRKTR
jgi:hypothetical protein